MTHTRGKKPLTASKKRLKHWFALSEFRPGQKDIINSIFKGHDTIAVMPTGSGKSLCYQYAAYELGGLSIVVSPLISLMRDQVQSLKVKGLSAFMVHSGQSAAENNQALYQAMNSHEAGILFLSPERLQTDSFYQALNKKRVHFLAIDEAHCISQWGHDFRVSYSKLSTLKSVFPEATILATTATATPSVIEDISKQLKLNKPTIYQFGFYRKNLFYQSQLCKSDSEKRLFLDRVFQRHRDQIVLVYAGTRKMVEQLCMHYRAQYKQVGYYHAGLKAEERSQIQDAFSKGQYKLFFATNAFGMGIDQSHVRAVVHYNLPSNIESYYQEVGRAGRDGKPSLCLLLHSSNDIKLQTYFIEQSSAPKAVIKSRWSMLDTMLIYSKDRQCRSQLILKYFKDPKQIAKCGHCDNCAPNSRRLIQLAKHRKKHKPVSPKKIEYSIQALKKWRDSYGAKMGLPGFKVLSQKTITEITEKAPQSFEHLYQIESLNALQINTFGKQMLSDFTSFS